MKHLTDEQLGARLDGELPPQQAEAAERHLAECAACRERLAALTGSDAALARALEHDPGEAYFASFADRVQARIDAAGAAAPEPARPARGWWSRPAALTWAGAAAALVVVGAFAIQYATHNVTGGAPVAERTPLTGADRREGLAADAAPQAQAPPAASSGPAAASQPAAPSANEAPAAAPAAPAAERTGFARDVAPAPATLAAPGRVQQLRTLPNGEQVPVQSRPLPQSDAKRALTAPSAGSATVPKPAAAPLAPAPAAAPLAMQSSEGEASALRADEGAAPQLCGRVTDTAGRALANATVTVVETGRSATSGADGRFCLEAPAGATLSVLSVGYKEHRAVARSVDASGEVAVALAPVSPLGTESAPVARFKVPAPPPAALQGETGATRAERDVARAMKLGAGGSAPAIPALPGETAQARTAREASEAALRLGTADAWTRAGALWEGVAAGAGADAAGDEARYRAAEARMSAWRLARGDAYRFAASDAVDAYLARAPEGARRTTVEKWRKELPPR